MTKATITINEVDDYTEVIIDGGKAERFPNLWAAAVHAALAGATDYEIGPALTMDQVAEFKAATAKGQELRADAEARWERLGRAVFSPRRRVMGRDRFGKYRGLAIEY
jgi:hypothetical protein